MDSETSSKVASDGFPEAEVKNDLEVISETTPEDTLNLNELIHEFFNQLIEFKERIIGKPFDEIYIELDDLLEEYEEKFKITF